MKKSISIFAAAILMLLYTASAAARDTIKIVGSSTVYPFATVVAERFINQLNLIHQLSNRLDLEEV